jgi:hypothetical protein
MNHQQTKHTWRECDVLERDYCFMCDVFKDHWEQSGEDNICPGWTQGKRWKEVH